MRVCHGANRLRRRSHPYVKIGDPPAHSWCKCAGVVSILIVVVDIRVPENPALLLPGVAVNAANTGAEIPTGLTRETRERTAVINSDIVEVRSVSEVTVDGGQLVFAGGSEMAS